MSEDTLFANHPGWAVEKRPMHLVEIVGAVFGLISVWLTIRQNILCWPTGLIQVSLYLFVFFEAKLYSDLLLHAIYVVLQLYGWHHWLHGGKERQELGVSLLSPVHLACWIGLGATGGLFWGGVMYSFTDAAAPYADALILSLSLVAQYLMALKKLESWYFWIAVDVLAVGVYFSRALYPTTALYGLFLIMATTGYFEWRRAVFVQGAQEPIET